MRRAFRSSYWFVATLFAFLGCQQFTPDDLAFTIQQARQSGSPIPLITEIVPRLTVDEAYYVQNAWLEKNLVEDVLFGFKAGVNSKVAQEKFNISEPVGGLLLESARRFPGDTLYIQTMLKPRIEVEFGYQINDYISEPILEMDTLKNKVEAVYVMVEIPDLGFEDSRLFNASDLVAANVATAFYLADTVSFNPDTFDWNDTTLRLMKDGNELISGKGVDALGNQWQALKWLVNHYVEKGYVIGKGQVLITGALGAMVEAQTGMYDVYLEDSLQYRFYLK